MTLLLLSLSVASAGGCEVRGYLAAVQAEVVLPDGTAFARVYDVPESSVVLSGDDVLPAVLSGDGITVRAGIRRRDVGVHATRRELLDGWLLATPGARLGVDDVGLLGVDVRVPSVDGVLRDTTVPSADVVGRVPCGALTLDTPGDDATPTLEVGDDPLEVRRSPDGDVAVVLPWTTFAEAVARRGSWTKVRAYLGAGLYAVGWVPTARTRPAETGQGEGMSGDGAGCGLDWLDATMCADAVPLSVRVVDSGLVVPIGEIEPQTPFYPGEDRGDLVSVTFAGGFLHVYDGMFVEEDGFELVVPAWVRGCPTREE